MGEGGMGVVYKAKDTHLDRLVAIKLLPAERVAEPERKRRFIQEAKAASALNHPNIITIYDIDSAEGVHFIAMEYVAGKTLHHLISRKGLPPADVLKFAVQIADALATAHAAGIVHRDLKPANIMVTDKGLVKVLDFGLAKLTEAASGDEGETLTGKDAPRTEEGAILGTVAYMSPEQAEGKKVDARSDIFSFGSVLYEMITGRRAFRRETRVSTLSAILKEEPQAISSIAEDSPRDLEKIVVRCLRKDLARRFQHMDDVKIALEELREESDSGKFTGAVASQRKHPRRWWWPVAAACVLLLAAGVLLVVRQLDRPLPPMRTVPLTSLPGTQTQPQLSPDGNFVAFAWDGPNQDNYFQIYVQQIGTGSDPLRLTSGMYPHWSPDGRYIAFGRQSPAPAVFVVPALGGAERKVGVARSSPAGWPMPVWSPDGRYLVVGEPDASGAPWSIHLWSVETGEKQRLTSPPKDSFGDVYGVIPADGEALVFQRIRSSQASDLLLQPLSRGYVPRGEPRRLTSDEQGISGFTFAPDARSVVFASNRGGGWSLWRVALNSPGAVEPLPVGGEKASEPTVCARRNRLAFVHGNVDTNIYRMEVGKPDPPVPFIVSTRIERAPEYSPDGRKIAFVSDRSGHYEVWICNSDASNPAQLTNLAGPAAGYLSWSPDGRRIVFNSAHQGQAGIYVVDADGGPPRLVAKVGQYATFPRWSPDGRWIYFTSFQGHSYEAQRVPVDGSAAPAQISQKGCNRSLLSADGKVLFYVSYLRPGIFSIPADGGEETPVLADVPPSDTWAVTRRGIYFLNRRSMPLPTIDLYSFVTHKVTTVATLSSDQKTRPVRSLAISPDDRWILLVQADRTGSDLMLVENFR
jgi:Tol biopolymer transport system component